MKYSKQLAAMLLAAVMTASLAGCGKTEETAEAVAAAIRGGTQPMRLAARRLYDTLFSEQAAQASCRGALEHLLLTGERHE